MSTLVVVEHVSLDGVLQGPGRPDEDVSGGFRHGGWAVEAGADPVLSAAMGEVMGDGFAWLLGRRTYDDVLAHWNAVGGPFADGLTSVPKHVVSSDPTTELPWPHSHLLTGDVPAAVARLREEQSGPLVVMGSAQLVQTLLLHDLVDELLLFVHPVLLGPGKRLFGDHGRVGQALEPQRFRLARADTTASGVLVTHHVRTR